MITFKSSVSKFQITIPADEYCIYLEDAVYPNGDECEALVIVTPRKKYKLIGINSGKLEGYEFVDLILGYIGANISAPNIYIDLESLIDSEYCIDMPIIILKVE